MIKLLIKKFIKNHENLTDPVVRSNYTLLTGIVGIICNVLLFALKLGIGMFTGSIALIGDSVNNLSDSLSSVISVVSSKVSSSKADIEHPYGHGRFEYIATLIIAFLVVLAGFEVLKEAFAQLFRPSVSKDSFTAFLIMIFALFVKIWMFSYNRYVAKLTDSSVNDAVARDSLNDIISTVFIIISLVLSPFTDLQLDAVAGLIVGVFVLYSGYSMAKEMIDVLLGSVNPEQIQEVREFLEKDPDVVFVGNVDLHDYGPRCTIGTAHLVVSAKLDLYQAHSVIDRLERRLLQEKNIQLVIHIEPSEDHLDVRSST